MPRRRRFLLARSPDTGPPELTPADREHALRVLRVAPGDRLEGLDGRGRAFGLEVTRAGRRELELAATGEVREEPPPGAPGAPLPWLEVRAPLPKGGRAEDMLGVLTQLGVARLVPLVTDRSEVQAREASAGRLERLERAAGEALKQSGRLWMPELSTPIALTDPEALAGTCLRLAPGAPRRLAEALASAGPGPWTRERPLALLVGPEGGWTPEEEARLEAAGALGGRLGPHVLRLEAAAAAGLAVLVEALQAP
jgi:16S rRNA (uracil1498-N3)-methyltransferase